MIQFYSTVSFLLNERYFAEVYNTSTDNWLVLTGDHVLEHVLKTRLKDQEELGNKMILGQQNEMVWCERHIIQAVFKT